MTPSQIGTLCRGSLASALTFLGIASIGLAGAQPPASDLQIAWRDAATLSVEGRGFADTKAVFDRLPRSAEGRVRQPVWDLSHDSAGMLVHFSTDACELRVRWDLLSDSLALPNLASSAASGLDLYVRIGRDWHWLAAARPEPSHKANEATLFKDLPAGYREYLLYLPLYNGIESLQLGFPVGSRIDPVVRQGKPIVFYGTSITQGGSVARPGMAYPAVLGRRLEMPVVNLGFSGNAKAEPEIAELVSSVDSACYVLDCLPNLGPDEVPRMEKLVAALRSRHPTTPIVLVEAPEYPDGVLIASRRAWSDQDNAALRAVYEKARRNDPLLFYVPTDGLIGEDGEGTVDGTHPTDLGTMRMVEKIQPILAAALVAETSKSRSP